MATANEESTATDQMANFDVVTEEAVEPEQQAEDMKAPGEAGKGQEDQGDNSASAPAGSEDADHTDDGEQGGKEAGDNNADSAGEVRKPKGARYQKRIDRLTKRAAEAERRAQELEAQLQQQDGGQQQDQSRSADAGEEPDPSNFDTYDEYLNSLSDWKAGKSPRSQSKQDQGAPKQQGNNDGAEDDDGFAEVLEDVQAAFEDTREQYDDFDEVIGQQDLSITRDMVKALADTDDPGGIAYHLGTNKAEAARIAALSPIAQAKEIGKVEAMLQSKPPKRGKKTTQAPDPIEPVRGADSSVADPSNMSFDEYETAMNEREMKRGRGFW